MTRARIALLALCTLLVGAGHRLRRGQPGRLAARPTAETATTTAATLGHNGEAADGRARGLPTGRDVRLLPARASARSSTRRIPGVALDDLDALYKTDAYVRRTCHPLAHEIGHLAYAKYKSVTTAEGYARETCWSGYHHGLMESYISQFNDKQLRTRMNGICTQDPSHPYSLAYYNCWHGLGHGLTIRFTAGHLPRAALLQRDQPQLGAPVVLQRRLHAEHRRQRQRHAPRRRPQAERSRSTPATPSRSSEKPSCYLMQTSYVLQVKNWNLPVAFRICDRVEARYVGTCYRSMGRDISGAALLDPAQGRRRSARSARPRTAPSASPEPPPTRSTTATARDDGRRALPARATPPSARRAGRRRSRRSRRCSARRIRAKRH